MDQSPEYLDGQEAERGRKKEREKQETKNVKKVKND